MHSHKLKTAAPAGVDIKKVHVKEGSSCPSSASHRQHQKAVRSARKRVAQTQPEGFEDPKSAKKVCKLQRSIYGLKQSSRK
jgi:hypothetical protein